MKVGQVKIQGTVSNCSKALNTSASINVPHEGKKDKDFPQGVPFGLESRKPERRQKHSASHQKERNHCWLGDSTDDQPNRASQDSVQGAGPMRRDEMCAHRICCGAFTAHHCGSR